MRHSNPNFSFLELTNWVLANLVITNFSIKAKTESIYVLVLPWESKDALVKKLNYIQKFGIFAKGTLKVRWDRKMNSLDLSFHKINLLDIY